MGPGLNSFCSSPDGHHLVQGIEGLVEGGGEGLRIENGYQFQSPRRQDNWAMSVGGLKWRGEDGEETALSLQSGWRRAQPEIPG